MQFISNPRLRSYFGAEHNLLQTVFWSFGEIDRMAAWLVLLPWSIFVAVACISSSDAAMPESEDDVMQGVERIVDDAPVSEEAGDAEANRRGGFLRAAIATPWIPDPTIGIDPGSQMLFREIYNGLTAISDDPSEPLKLDLAQGFEVMDGGRRYSFLLHPELKFSDGTPLTASDVKWSWERALAPATGSEGASATLGNIAGAAEILSGVASELAGVEVVDERRLIVTLAQARSDFLASLADPAHQC